MVVRFTPLSDGIFLTGRLIDVPKAMAKLIGWDRLNVDRAHIQHYWRDPIGDFVSPLQQFLPGNSPNDEMTMPADNILLEAVFFVINRVVIPGLDHADVIEAL